jgi:hypothetical protein
VSKPQELTPWIAFLRSDPAKQVEVSHADNIRAARAKGLEQLREANRSNKTLRSKLWGERSETNVDAVAVYDGEKIEAAKARVLAQAMGAGA